MTGNWDAAEAELAQAADADGLADIELLACDRRGWHHFSRLLAMPC